VNDMQQEDQLIHAQLKAQLAQASDKLLREIEAHRRFLQKRLSSLQQMQSVLVAANAACAVGAADASLPCLTLNADTTIASASSECALLLGESTAKLSGQRFSTLVSPSERERWCQLFRQSLVDHEPHWIDLALERRDGSLFDIRLVARQLNQPEQPAKLYVAFENVSAFKQIDQELALLRRSEEVQADIPANDWLHHVIEQSFAGIYLIQDGRFAYANQGFADIFGYVSSDEIIRQKSIEELIAPQDRPKVSENIRRRADGEVPEMRYSFTGVRKDGRHIEVEVHGRRMMFNGKSAVIGVILDITERKLAEQQLRIAATAFESQEGMIVTDANKVILRVNEAFSAITGYASDEIVGRTTELLHSGRHNEAFYADIWQSVARTGSWQGETWNRRKNGEIFPLWLTMTAVTNEGGGVTHFVATMTDITARKTAEAEIEYLAFYDQLTRLPNRRLLLDRLQQALMSSRRSGTEGALLFIDLDNFKDINDTLGHEKGDLLLQLVAERLKACVRDGDTLARLGGDEFVMIIEGLSNNPDEAAAQSKVVGEKILSALNEVYPLDHREHRNTPSIGITLFSADKSNINELLKRADLAMYQAKDAGRNTLRFFDPSMQAAVTARTALETDLRSGLRDGQFLLHYQPQVGSDGQLIGVEALARWQHPRRGLIFPNDFIHIAESSKLIFPLGQWVLETACKQLVAWEKSPRTAQLSMAVNVSALQFHHPDFVLMVTTALTSTGANPHHLKLELTESLLLNDLAEVIEKMAALKIHGIEFSLDDFGTGYSSLAYLKRLPLSQLKIDRSFVSDVLTDGKDVAITSAIIALANGLGLSVIAEGVETDAQRTFLANQGCKCYQGYLYGRPDVVESLEPLLQLQDTHL